jgi:hypothetical protein
MNTIEAESVPVVETITEPVDEPDSPETIALRAWHAGDPDGQSIRIRAAWRDLSCKQSGTEVFRRVMYPGQSTDQWPDSARLPALGASASARRCTEFAQVPVGSLVTEFERRICTASFALVGLNADGKGYMVECEHKVLRSRPVYVVTLPDGTMVEVPRRDER